MKTFAELELAKAEGKACDNCAFATMTGRIQFLFSNTKVFCGNPNSLNTEVPRKHLCRQYTDTLPENLEEDAKTR